MQLSWADEGVLGVAGFSVPGVVEDRGAKNTSRVAIETDETSLFLCAVPANSPAMADLFRDPNPHGRMWSRDRAR